MGRSRRWESIGGKLLGGRVGEEPPDPGFHLITGGSDQVPGRWGGDGSVAGDQGWFLIAVVEGPVDHHGLDVEVHSGGEAEDPGGQVSART